MSNEVSSPRMNLWWQQQTQDFRYCCGTTEIGGFQLVDVSDTNPRMSLNDYKEKLAAVMRSNSVGSIIATTVEDSNEFNCQKNLKLAEMGFEQAAKYRNPNSGNTVIIWHISRDKV